MRLSTVSFDRRFFIVSDINLVPCFIMRQSILIFCLLFCLAFCDAMAQPTAVMEADGPTSLCVSGTVKLKIKFTGTAPFGFVIDRSGIGTYEIKNGIPLSDPKMINGWYHFEITLDQSSTFSLIKVWDDTTIPFGSSSSGTVITGQSVDVSVFSMPNPSIGTYSPACGFSIPLNALPDPVSTTYHWEAAEGTFTDATISNAVFTTPNQTEGTFPLTFIQQNGACTTTKSVNITLRATPKSTLSGSKSVCLVSGNTYQLDANVNLTGHAPFNYQLSDGINSYPRTNQPSGTTVTQVPATAHNQTYAITSLTDANGCSAIPLDMSGSALVSDLSPGEFAGDDIFVCGLSTSTAATLNQGVGSWSFVSNGVGAVIDDAASAHSEISASSYGWAELKWTGNNGGCIHADNVKIHFAQPVDLQLDKDQLTICEGQNALVDLILSGKAPWTVDYLSGSQLQTSTIGTSPGVLVVTPSESTTYVIDKVTSVDGCAVNPAKSFSVVVEPLEPANAGVDLVLDRKYEVQLSAVPINLAGDWVEINNKTFHITDATDPQATLTNLAVGKYTFKWTTRATVCPSTSDEIDVEVLQYSAYNGISPNGDGINDKFEIDGLNDLLNAELTVFDAKGKLVYRKKNYDNSWQGEGADGQPLPDGIYYYEFKSDQHESIRDYVVVRRKKDASSNQ